MPGKDAQVLDRAPAIKQQSLDGAHRNALAGSRVGKSAKPCRFGRKSLPRRDLSHQPQAALLASQAGKNVRIQFVTKAAKLCFGVLSKQTRFVGDQAISRRNGTGRAQRRCQVAFHSVTLKVCHAHAPSLARTRSATLSSLPPNSIYRPLAGQVIVLTGATASGKSDAAIQVAESIRSTGWSSGHDGGEIVSLDALAVYRGMDIGTAKPDADARQRIPHHLIDVVDPDEEFSVAEYLRLAHRTVAEILARNRVPIFVGGTPMYLKAVLRGFDPGPPADPDFRAAVQRDVDTYGAEALHQRLCQVDPLSAHRIDPTDVRRMIRALEVAHATGTPISHRQTQFDRPAPTRTFTGASEVTRRWATLGHALRWPRPVLHARINRRVDAMFERGLVDEVRQLRSRFGTLSRTAAQAVGYREVIEMLDETDGDERPSDARITQCREEVAAHTRQLARRQETWFRSFDEIEFVDVNDQSQIDTWVTQQFDRGD